MKVKKNKQKKLNIFRLIFVCLLLFFVVEIVKQEIKIYELKTEIETTKNKISELSKKEKSLIEEEKMINDAKYIEKIAREEYNMVKTLEIPITLKEEKEP